MKNDMPAWLLGVAVLLFVGAMLTGEDEMAMVGMFLAACSVVTYLVTLRSRVPDREVSGDMELRLSELERRLGLTEGELDVANEQLQRLRAEREFDRALAAGPGAGGEPRTPLGPR